VTTRASVPRPLSAEDVIERLGLEPHPEGGHYVETWRHAPKTGRGAGTAIYFLLRTGEVSACHRIDADEIWHHYAGAPLELRVSPDAGRPDTLLLGPDLEAGARPQQRVPARAWQSARSLGDWSLAGCTVSPAFEFEHFELAPQGWEPGTR